MPLRIEVLETNHPKSISLKMVLLKKAFRVSQFHFLLFTPIEQVIEKCGVFIFTAKRQIPTVSFIIIKKWCK